MLKILIPLVSVLTGASDDAESARMEEMNQAAVTTMKEQLVAVAEKRGLEVRPEQVTYATLGSSFMVHAPPADADKHSEEEFARGVDVTVIYVGGTEHSLLPRGFYVVRAIVPMGAEQGKAQFIDASGEIVATSPLYVRSRDQEVAFFPEPPGPGPVQIPNITSTHIFRNGQKYVDCYFHPGKTLYYAM